MIQANRVQLGACIIIFAQGVSYPVSVQEEATHVGVVDEYDAKEIIHFALKKVGSFPQVGYRV